jgi:hypothetical protein
MPSYMMLRRNLTRWILALRYQCLSIGIHLPSRLKEEGTTIAPARTSGSHDQASLLCSWDQLPSLMVSLTTKKHYGFLPLHLKSAVGRKIVQASTTQ